VAPRPVPLVLASAARAPGGALILALCAVLGACAEPVSAPSTATAVVGLGYSGTISPQDVGRLEATGELLSVIQCARVAILRTTASDADLRALPGVIDTGPVLLGPDSLTVEAAVTFAAGPLRDADILGIQQIGRIEAIESAFRVIWIFAEAHDLGRLDRLPRITSCGIVRQDLHPVPPAP
jgi:hypothetical protein